MTTTSAVNTRTPGTIIETQGDGAGRFAVIVRRASHDAWAYNCTGNDTSEQGYVIRYGNGCEVWRRDYDVCDIRVRPEVAAFRLWLDGHLAGLTEAELLVIRKALD